MSRPLNEYPKEELEYLERVINSKMYMAPTIFDYELANQWHNRICEAISDRELADKELPFKTEDNESREFEL